MINVNEKENTSMDASLVYTPDSSVAQSCMHYSLVRQSFPSFS